MIHDNLSSSSNISDIDNISNIDNIISSKIQSLYSEWKKRVDILLDNQRKSITNTLNLPIPSTKRCPICVTINKNANISKSDPIIITAHAGNVTSPNPVNAISLDLI